MTRFEIMNLICCCSVIAFLCALWAAITYWSRFRCPCSAWSGGIFFSTKHASRVFGRTGTTVINGKWTGWVESLWKLNGWESTWFIVYIDELGTPKITNLYMTEAKAYIHTYADDCKYADKLIKEWFDSVKSEWR